jgi:hypothetical protein
VRLGRRTILFFWGIKNRESAAGLNQNAARATPVAMDRSLRSALALVLAISAACAAEEAETGTEGSSDADGSTLSTSAGTSTTQDGSTESSNGSSGGSTGADPSSDASESSASTSSSEVTGSTGDPIPADCEPVTDCEECGALAGCGWCGTIGTCTAGNANGPSAGSCAGGWVTEGDFFSCPAANCFGRTSCTDCQDAFTGCGWCASTGTCMAGAPDMPAAPAMCADQQWYFDICPADCADEMTGVSCTGTVGCGWCAGGGGCLPGTDAGPIEGACGSGWSTDTDTCF